MIESPLDTLMIIARQKVEAIEEKRMAALFGLHAENPRIASIA